MNIPTIRLLSQQLASPQFNDPAEVVEWMGAVQGQEYRLMRWAVAMRTKKPSAEAFQQAYDSGRIIRQHLMRGTWQLVAGSDFHWMMDLFAPKATKVIKGWMRANGIDIPEEEEERIREVLLRTAHKKKSATKEDFAEAIARQGITMDDHRLSYHIRFAELKGFLCSGDLLPMKATYSVASEKIPRGETLERDEALARITLKYFRSRQPATLEDFVWWTGLSLTDCRRGISLLGDWLHIERQDGREFYVTDDCRTGRAHKGQYLLVPPYDEYLIGYKSRDIVLPPEHRHKAHNNSGNFSPIIVRDGTVCGNWTPFTGDVEATFFSDDPSLKLPDEAAAEYLVFRDLK